MPWQKLKKRRNYHVILQVTAIVSCLEVHAENNSAEVMRQLAEMELEDLMEIQIVTIATGSKQTVAKAPATTNVITAEDIAAMGATDLDEVLETVRLRGWNCFRFRPGRLCQCGADQC